MAINANNLVYANTKAPQLSVYDELEKNLRKQREADVARMNQNQTADIAKSNAGYDSSAKQNYINYMQAQKKLPSELNALGIRGGATESSLIRLGTNYGANVASNEAARNAALNDIRAAYAKQIGDYDADLNERLYTARATAQENQLKWEQEQLDKDLERFSGAIEGLYTNKSGYEKLIAQLQASNDPNKEYKIMLARRAMNQLGSSSGGGGGGGSRRSYGGYGGYGNSTAATTAGNAKTKVGTTAGNANTGTPTNIAQLIKKIAEDTVTSKKKKTTGRYTGGNKATQMYR